jgi:integrase
MMTSKKTASPGRDATGSRQGKRPSRFSDTYLKTLKPPPGQRELIQFEAGTGLGVRVSANNISFIVQTRLKDGRRWRETLASYGALTVEQARSIAQERSADAKRGGPEGDLFKKRADEIAQARLSEQAKKVTLRFLLDRWRTKHLVNRAPSYAKRSVSAVERVFTRLLDEPAALIAKKQVREALDHVTGPGAARQAAVALLAAFNWAVGEDYLSASPLHGLKLPPLPPPRDRVLDAAEARRAWAAASRLPYPSGPLVCLLMLTACRLNEIARLRWNEIVEDDDGRKAIVLPGGRGGRTKTGAGHLAPLTPAALDVLAACPPVVGCKYVFSSDGRRASNNSDRIKKALDAEIKAKGEPVLGWRFHDLRHTIVSTLASEQFGYDPIVLDKLLGHTPVKLRGMVGRYQHHEYGPTRRRALEDWATFLTRPAAEIVTLRAKSDTKADTRPTPCGPVRPSRQKTVAATEAARLY